MSEKNRRTEYDRLVKAGAKIPEVLVKEFGDPAQKAKVETKDKGSNQKPGAAIEDQENGSDEQEKTDEEKENSP